MTIRETRNHEKDELSGDDVPRDSRLDDSNGLSVSIVAGLLDVTPRDRDYEFVNRRLDLFMLIRTSYRCVTSPTK